MPIRKIERYTGGTRADVTRIAGLAKELNLRNGATDYVVSQIHVGEATGQWLAEIVYRDWDTYGRVTAAMAADLKWQAALAELAKTTTLQDRVLVVELDL